MPIESLRKSNQSPFTSRKILESHHHNEFNKHNTKTSSNNKNSNCNNRMKIAYPTSNVNVYKNSKKSNGIVYTE